MPRLREEWRCDGCRELGRLCPDHVARFGFGSLLKELREEEKARRMKDVAEAFPNTVQ